MTHDNLMTMVVPNGAVLYCNGGAWEYFHGDRAFEDGREYLAQASNETFESFMERVVQRLIEDEAADPESDNDVTINHAIWRHK